MTSHLRHTPRRSDRKPELEISLAELMAAATDGSPGFPPDLALLADCEHASAWIDETGRRYRVPTNTTRSLTAIVLTDQLGGDESIQCRRQWGRDSS